MVVTRDAAVPVLGAVLVAPVTRTVRGIPTEITLGRDEGLPEFCLVVPALATVVEGRGEGYQ